jgi:hypothetical protein
LMPRMRGLSDAIFYRPDKSIRYEHVDGLFTGDADWDLIATHMRDMIQVVLSIQAGRVMPSMLLRKLGTHNRRSLLYRAFRELGRVEQRGRLRSAPDFARPRFNRGTPELCPPPTIAADRSDGWRAVQGSNAYLLAPSEVANPPASRPRSSDGHSARQTLQLDISTVPQSVLEVSDRERMGAREALARVAARRQMAIQARLLDNKIGRGVHARRVYVETSLSDNRLLLA